MSIFDLVPPLVEVEEEPAVGDERHRGQLRMAERLAAREAHRLIYVHGLGWHVWDGTRWAPDRNGAATRAGIDTVKAAYKDLHDLSKDERDALLRDIGRVESASGIEGMVRLAGNILPLAVAVDELDRDPYLLNVANGTLDLRSGTLKPHDPGDLITKVAGTGYHSEAASEVFNTFLAEVLPDETMRTFVGRLFGLALLGKVVEHVLPIATGTGCNGKSTLLNVVMAALGDYAISAEPELLVDRGTSHPTGQADLLGVRLAVCSETEQGRRLAAATVKRLTGGDKVRARRMRQDFIEFDPSHSIVLVTNFKPVVAGDDPALWRRIRIVPFDVVISNPDSTLPDRLLLDLPAVLAWMVEGHQDWHHNGLSEPENVLKATASYKAASDSLGRFLDERTITGNEYSTVKARELYSTWTAWCHTNGEDSCTEKAFSEAMLQRGYTKVRRNTGVIWTGLLLASEEES